MPYSHHNLPPERDDEELAMSSREEREDFDHEAVGMERERSRQAYDCGDGMCGATDCQSCHPGGGDEADDEEEGTSIEDGEDAGLLDLFCPPPEDDGDLPCDPDEPEELDEDADPEAAIPTPAGFTIGVDLASEPSRTGIVRLPCPEVDYFGALPSFTCPCGNGHVGGTGNAGGCRRCGKEST
jgi:hypothetical protein